jgi:hypothetical protein
MVNPSIDGNGLTSADFDEDPDFREAYFSGAYDVPCPWCHGQRVMSFWVLAEREKRESEDLEDRITRMTMESEQRMGA